jgi:ABC-2 type transport system permease protein
VSSLVYTRYELLRALRNRRFFIFSLAFPLLLYLVIAVPNRGEQDVGDTGVSAPLYFMVGLVAFAGMVAVLASGARIAAERTAGWNRQLRLTPLSTRAYFRTKVITAYLSALLGIVLLYVAGIALGVRLSAGEWLEMTGLVLLGLLPFAALGVLLGHLLTADSVGPASGATIGVFALLGGVWFPLGSGVLGDIGRWLPSYWLVQASRVSLGESGWGYRGWIVVAVWTLAASALAARAYRRDTKRV